MSQNAGQGRQVDAGAAVAGTAPADSVGLRRDPARDEDGGPPEAEPAHPGEEPVAGGTDDAEPAQGPGAPDSH